MRPPEQSFAARGVITALNDLSSPVMLISGKRKTIETSGELWYYFDILIHRYC